MVEQPEEPSGLQCAVKRLSSVLNRRASPVSTSLKRITSSKRDSTCSLPDKDAAPSRSALKGGRWPGLSDDRRVSFHDSLPCLRFGPPFEYQMTSAAEPVDRRNGLLLPAITADDRNTDARFRHIEYDRKQSATDSVIPGSATRRYRPVAPAPLHRTKTVRYPRAGFGGTLELAEQRRTCVDLTEVVTKDKSRCQSRLRPLPLFADRPRGDRSSWTSVRERSNGPVQQAANPQTPLKRTSHVDCQANAASTYQAHVDRSLRLMQTDNRPRSWYMCESLVQMQHALAQTGGRPVIPRPQSTGDLEASWDRVQALFRLSHSDDDDASEDEMEGTSPTDLSDTVAHLSTHSHKSATKKYQKSFARADDLETAAKPSSLSGGKPSLLPTSPPPIPARNPARRLNLAVHDRRSVTIAGLAEEKDGMRDSGVSIHTVTGAGMEK